LASEVVDVDLSNQMAHGGPICDQCHLRNLCFPSAIQRYYQISALIGPFIEGRILARLPFAITDDQAAKSDARVRRFL
jgi:hypothetical protein